MENLDFSEAKTRYAAQMFKNLSQNKEMKKIMRGNGVLVTLTGKDEKARRTLRNLPYVGLEEARNLTALQVLQYKYLLFSKEALKIFDK